MIIALHITSGSRGKCELSMSREVSVYSTEASFGSENGFPHQGKILISYIFLCMEYGKISLVVSPYTLTGDP